MKCCHIFIPWQSCKECSLRSRNQKFLETFYIKVYIFKTFQHIIQLPSYNWVTVKVVSIVYESAKNLIKIHGQVLILLTVKELSYFVVWS